MAKDHVGAAAPVPERILVATGSYGQAAVSLFIQGDTPFRIMFLIRSVPYLPEAKRRRHYVEFSFLRLHASPISDLLLGFL